MAAAGPDRLLSLDGVSIAAEDVDTLSTACGLSLNLIAYLFRTFALAKAVEKSGAKLVDPSAVMRLASQVRGSILSLSPPRPLALSPESSATPHSPRAASPEP